MRIAYSIAQKAEAVALVRVVGAEAAAGQLGIARTTLVKWAALAGHRPEIDTDGWRGLHDLAVAKTTAAVASGKLPPRTVAIIAGIAARNLRPARTVATVDPADPNDPEPLTTAARERFTDWIEALPDDDRRAVKRSIHQELNRRAGEVTAVRQREEAPLTDTEGEALWDGLREATAASLPTIVARVAAADALEAARRRQCEIAGRWIDDDAADLLIEAEKYLEEIEL